jgi:hypothetical protein
MALVNIIVSCIMGALIAWMVHSALHGNGCSIVTVKEHDEEQRFVLPDKSCVRYDRYDIPCGEDGQKKSAR